MYIKLPNVDFAVFMKLILNYRINYRITDDDPSGRPKVFADVKRKVFQKMLLDEPNKFDSTSKTSPGREKNKFVRLKNDFGLPKHLAKDTMPVYGPDMIR